MLTLLNEDHLKHSVRLVPFGGETTHYLLELFGRNHLCLVEVAVASWSLRAAWEVGPSSG